MQQIEKIELSPIEATAYLWVNIIKDKVREIFISEASNKKEVKFVEIFYHYTEFEWRYLYLELTKYIIEDVNNFISNEHTTDNISLDQDTNIKGHDLLNKYLSKITGRSIPDIRLARNSSKDSVIYTNNLEASVWYKSCGVVSLATKYEKDYILTGNIEELDFYNLIISTIIVLKEEDITFNSTLLLRERFCKEYVKINQLEDIEGIKEKFNMAFDKACDKRIVLGRYWKDIYSSHFYDIDYVGLDKYFETAKHYASVILGKDKDKVLRKN